MEEVHCPLPWWEWDRSLATDLDQHFQAYIIDGLRYGYQVGFDYQHAYQKSLQNMSSALEQPQVIWEYLSVARARSWAHWTFCVQVHTSQFGVIPKGTTGKWHLILDMFSPEGRSVNDGIPEALYSLSYVSVDNAAKAKVVVPTGRGVLWAEVDVKSAYRNVSMHPEDQWLIGMLWKGGLYIDTTTRLDCNLPPIFS